MNDPIDLNGKLLIAMPGMGDPRFAHSVVFICAHSPEGAMGIVVNKPTEDLGLKDLLEQLSITSETDMTARPVHFGGPVESGRGFVLHEYGYHSSISTMDVNDSFAMTATLDILEDLAQGRGPSRAIIALGYAGWGPGQLEAEIAQNGWLTCDAELSLVFETANANKWEAALRTLGIDALALSSAAGRA
ncbi:YqgE/AlgH family protein [Roseovarius sp. 2305UL8-3]|uniref:YqgE/AlgH family protein n=1 Tax=Roseovarius conchicola TaxID=3121636 RepID=UPI003528BEED